jgi:hypothetical protein
MTGTMSTTVTFPANGTYELSFLNAARPFWLGHTNYYGSHNYRVTMGGEQVLTRYSQKMCFERVTVRLPAITNAPVSKELCFDGINTLGGDRTSLFDDVRVSRLPDGDSAIVDGGFEMPVGFLPNGDMWGSGITGTAWTFDTNAISLNMSGIVRNGSAWNCPFALDGTAAAFLQMKARMSQPVTFTEDGYYTLSFMAVGRLQNWVGNWACLHDFRILFNGEQVGSVQTFDATWRRYTFRLPYVKAGVAHSLVFEGLNSMAYQLGTGTDHTSFLDDVRVEKQTAVGEAATPGSYRKLAVHLTEGSKLALDFSGQTVFKEIRYNGSPYSGTLDASNTPFLTGAGSVYVSPKGTVVLLH